MTSPVQQANIMPADRYFACELMKIGQIFPEPTDCTNLTASIIRPLRGTPERFDDERARDEYDRTGEDGKQYPRKTHGPADPSS